MIEVRDVVKRFGGLVAVDHCSLSVRTGSITGLIGPNGAGKSTLFNMVTGFLPPDEGAILLAGEDVTGMSPHRLFRKGLVRTFQIPHELSRVSVLENLMLVPAGQSGENLLNIWFRRNRTRRDEQWVRERAERVLEMLQLTHLRYERAGNLSGGQKKLLELGRTMMTDASVVLLDEPSAGVNRTLMRYLTETIQTLNRDHGYTFCVIEHDMDLITELCDPVICMAQGHVLAEGSMSEIRSNEAVLEAYFGGGAAVSAEASA